MSRLLVSMFTDRGAVRDHNEDRLAFRQFRHPTGNYEILAVADGMGGHARGEVAAQLALQAIEEFLGFGAWTDPGEALERAFQLANQRVHDEGGGMGTTLVALLVDVQTLQTWVANVGDSRAYVLRPTGPEALTRDHSEVAARVEAGLLTREEAESVEGRNVLLRAIGPDPEVEVDVSPPFELREGERLLLCSDGLHGMLPERQFLEMAASAGLGSEPAKLLAEAAIAAGGRDNVTVILAAPATEETVRMGSFPAPGRIRRKRRIPLQTLAATLGAVGIGLAAAGLVYGAMRGNAGDDTGLATGGTTPATAAATTNGTGTPLPTSAPTWTTVPPSPTATPVRPSPTATPVPPSPTATPVPPSPTATPVRPSPTATPTATATQTPPSAATSTPTPMPSPAPTSVQLSGLGVTRLGSGEYLVSWLPLSTTVDIRWCSDGSQSTECPTKSGNSQSPATVVLPPGAKVCVEIALSPATDTTAWERIRCLTPEPF